MGHVGARLLVLTVVLTACGSEAGSDAAAPPPGAAAGGAAAGGAAAAGGMRAGAGGLTLATGGTPSAAGGLPSGAGGMLTTAVRPVQVPGAHKLRRTIKDLCVLDEMGDLFCEGPARFERIGQGPFADYAVASGYACGLRSDQTLDCWSTARNTVLFAGCTAAGACLHDGMPPPGQGFVSVAGGSDAGCGVTTAGNIVCWGRSDSDLVRLPDGNDFVDIVSNGDDVLCARRKDGDAECWGNLKFLQPAMASDVLQVAVARITQVYLHGDGTISDSGFGLHSAIHVDTPLTAVSVSESDDSLCGLDAAGEAHCWAADYLHREQPHPGPFVEIANDDQNACALREDHSLWCWGKGYKGPGPEQCYLGSGQMTREGQTTHQYPVPARAWSLFMGESDGVWAYGGMLGRGFGMITGTAPLDGLPQNGFRTRLPPDASAGIDVSYWTEPSASGEGADVLCTPSGTTSSVHWNGDELVFSLDSVASIGPCPGGGVPVEGSLEFCEGNDCSDTLLHGRIGDVSFDQVETTPPLTGPIFNWSDGSVLRPNTLWSDDGETRGLVLYPSVDNPLYGRLVCVGVATHTSRAGADAADVVLADFSILGPCPTNGTEHVDVCVR